MKSIEGEIPGRPLKFCRCALTIHEIEDLNYLAWINIVTMSRNACWACFAVRWQPEREHRDGGVLLDISTRRHLCPTYSTGL